MTRQPRPEDLAIAFVGVVIPDEAQFRSRAFNRAANMAQQGLLAGWQRAGVRKLRVLSLRPLPSFPRDRRIWVGPERAHVLPGLSATLLPYVNVIALKQVMLGVNVAAALAAWAWQTRRRRRLVYAFNLSVPPGLLTLLAARLLGASAVVSLNDINKPGELVPSGLLWRLDYWLQRKLIPHFDGHVVVSDEIATEFLPGRPYLRMEGGIAQAILNETGESTRSAKPPGAPFVIAFAGTLYEANGVSTLLEAFSLLRQGGYRLRIAGSGSLEGAVRAAAKRDPRIEYLGFLSLSDVLDLYNSADVLVSLRVTKTLDTRFFFPSKMMEFLASGVPVIATCTGHVEEEFGDMAYLLRDETPEALAELIRTVASMPPEARAAVGRRARAYMAAHKTWDAQARRVLEFIRTTVLSRIEAVDR